MNTRLFSYSHFFHILKYVFISKNNILLRTSTNWHWSGRDKPWSSCRLSCSEPAPLWSDEISLPRRCWLSLFGCRPLTPSRKTRAYIGFQESRALQNGQLVEDCDRPVSFRVLLWHLHVQSRQNQTCSLRRGRKIHWMPADIAEIVVAKAGSTRTFWADSWNRKHNKTGFCTASPRKKRRKRTPARAEPVEFPTQPHRLYRRRFLQVNTRWKACTPLHRFGIHWRKMGKEGPGQNNPEKEENEKTRGQ